MGIVLLFEVLYVGLFSVVTGIAFGMLLDRLMYLIIARILHANYGVDFYISWKSTAVTSLVFCVSLPPYICFRLSE